ncbi:MAG: merR regulatory family protein [Herbinix sp.]|jgi:DNA-binding transcriptional MerR regulator|nr:merR regulatory family protein [Herbinix sp.]
MKDKLTTKQFADLCKVEKRTLFYYDEIDLLKPIEITEKGYRLYNLDQFDTMSMIKALQSVGMSLGDIKALMKERDITECKAVLNKQIELLKEKQEELRLAEQILSQTMDQLDRYLEKGCNQFYLEETPDTYLITREMPERSTKHINYISIGYHIGVIMQEADATVPWLIFKKAPDRRRANAIKPAGVYACIYQSVPNGKVSEAILSFMDILSSKHIDTEGPLYVDDLASDFIQFPNQEYIFNFSMKCKS